jgi:hypothetical protein
MKNKFLLFFSLLLLVACKKNKISNPADQTFDAVGTWSMYSTGSGPYTKTADSYPCLANNKLTFNADSSYLAFYAAADTCYLEHTQTSSYIVGEAGDSTKGSYQVIGHTIHLKTQYGPSVGVLSDSNNFEKVVIADTIGNNIYVSTFIK